jgi:hypothetical protein
VIIASSSAGWNKAAGFEAGWLARPSNCGVGRSPIRLDPLAFKPQSTCQ